MATKKSLTTAQAAEQITRSDSSWADTLGTGATVTYAFRASIPDDYLGEQLEADTFTRFNKDQIAKSELIFDLYEEVCGIKLVRVNPKGYSNDATMLLANYESDSDGSAGYSYSVGDGEEFPESVDADFWYNTLGDDQDGTDPVLKPGDYDFSTVMHELGHSLGLEHPADYNADPDDQPFYERDAEYREDSLQYTIESYFEATETGADHKGQYLRTLGLHDIAALQRLYGANMETRTGDDTYGFGGKGVYGLSSAKEKAVIAIWDAGGTDTLNFSKYSNTQTIDLNAAKFSSTGGLKWNVSIAKGVTIENAVGGSGKDTIVGNKAANVLSGGGGQDNLKGNGGSDRLIGGADHDRLDGGTGSDTADYSSLKTGIDVTLKGSTWVSVANIDTDKELDLIRNIENVTGGKTDDSLVGDGKVNKLSGKGGSDLLVGAGGNDVLIGGSGEDNFGFGLTTLAKLGLDFVQDFAKGDTLVLFTETFKAFSQPEEPVGISKGDFSSGTRLSGMGKGDHLFFDTDDSLVYYDSDGAGTGKSAVKFAELGTDYALGAGDFILI